MSRPSIRFTTISYWKERPDSLEPNLLVRDAHRPQSGLSPAGLHCWTRQTGAEDRAVHFTRRAPITTGLRRRPICAMPYWEERGGRGLSAGLGGGEGAFPVLSPLGSIDHSISVSPTCHLPQCLDCAACVCGRNDWSECALEISMEKIPDELWETRPPHSPQAPPPHHLQLHPSRHCAIHRPMSMAQDPLCLCVCVCGKRLLALASIHDHGHWADLHRPSGPRRHGLGEGEGRGPGAAPHSTSAYCVCWLHWHRLAYPSPPGMACSCSRGSTRFVVVRTLNSRFPCWIHPSFHCGRSPL